MSPSLFARRKTISRPWAKRAQPLCLEPLEDRSVPAAVGGLQVDSGSWDPHSILVRFRPDSGPAAVEGTHLARELSLVPGLRSIQLDPGVDVAKALDAYRADPDVLYASPNYLVRALDIPNDPEYGKLYAMNNTGQTFGTPDADIDHAELTFQGNGSTVVAIIDTGIDYNHPDLAGNIWTNTAEAGGAAGVDDDGNGYIDDVHGYDFANGDGDPMDDHYHGTHVAGTIGAVANNSLGVAGVSWDVQLMAVKFLDAGGSGTLENAVLAVQYVIDNHVPISNNSWGGGGFFQPLYDAIAAAGAQGHLFVAAAGNSGVDADFSPMYPAAYDLDNIVSVAATDHNDLLAGFSNYGATSVDLGAPGVDIYSTMPGGYGYLSGTSMATPHVAGVAALVHDLHPSWGYQEIKNVLLTTVDPIPALDGITVSGGRLNAYAAASGTPPPDTTGPRVNSSTPSGLVATAVAKVRLAFNEAVVNFDKPDISSFTGPGGAINVIDVVPVDGSNGRQYDVTFASQSAEGTYTMLIGPSDIQDASGNRMDQDRDGNQGEAEDVYTASFTIDYSPGPDGFGYEARLVDRENIDLVSGAPGVFTILDDVDDSYAAVDLGGNTFAFYGVVYSGADSLYVSSNGLITFGYGVADYTNYDLTDYPDNATIAPLWDDWVTYNDDDAVLGMFEDADSDGTMDRLIIEWSSVWRYGGSGSNATFQAILTLNSSESADPFVLNYPDIDTSDGAAEGRSATVGIKDTGPQGANRLLVSQNADSPYFGTGGALRFSVAPPAPGLYIENVSVNEGNSGTTTATFKVVLVGGPESGDVTVTWTTANGSATEADNDYEYGTGTLTFTPGETSHTFTVTVNGDFVDETNEVFFVNLSNASGSDIIDGQGRGTILDEDTASISVSPSSGLVTTEGGGTASISVVLTSQPTADVTITLSSSDTTEGTVSPASLIFTPANWNIARVATLTGVNDLIDDGDISYSITASASSSDPNYNGLAAGASAVNQDNDVVATYTNNTATNIPDNGRVTSTIAVTDSRTILDLNVRLHITHGRDEDLDVFLITPWGARIELFTDVGGNGKNFNNTILDDEAGTAITAGSAPFASTYRPEGLLSAVDGRNLLGTWTLEITDDKNGGQKGKLNSWSLTFLYEQPAGGGGSGGNARSRNDKALEAVFAALWEEGTSKKRKR